MSLIKALKNSFIICLMVSSTGNVFANQSPTPYPTDSRIKMVSFRENDVVPIYGKTFTATQVIFSKDEYVIDTEGGDTQGWIVHVPDNDNLSHMLFIKPTILGSDTNLTVVTNKHSYYFRLRSNKSLNDKYDTTYAVKYIYPEEEKQRLKASLARKAQKKRALINKNRNPSHYNWEYSFSGNHTIMPLHIFDDGVFTFFELKPNQAVPAVFAVDDKKGNEALVNSRIQGRYLVVQRTAPQFTLRNGRQTASVFNKKAIRQIRG